MEILYFKSLPSTHLRAKELLLGGKKAPFAVVCDEQTNGIGSRSNVWSGLSGNLFVSFCLYRSSLPKDLKLESASIYFAYILKDLLSRSGSSVWLKWPNDFYLHNKKCGGVITTLVGETLLCGIGLNLVDSPDGFGVLDVRSSRDDLLRDYFLSLEKSESWKLVFSNYEIEFYKNQNYFTNYKDKKYSLKESILQDDGSIVVDGERLYSLR